MTTLDKRKLYRLPWNLYDNPVGWVEITDKCNMQCRGCYRNYIETREGHKSLDEIKKEVLFMERERNASEISLAGGEPLLHPHLSEIVKFISERGLGAKIFTNGKGLSRELVQRLAWAGLGHITFHIDSFQTREDNWDNRSESELNALRQYYVDMCAKVRGLDFSFACMVNKKNLGDIPGIVRWALDNKGAVRGLAFFAIRSYQTVDHGGRPELVGMDSEDNITSSEIYNIIRNRFPHFDVAAYFGGTVNPESFKWLFSASVCSSNSLLGSIGPITMELYQVLTHLMYGRYLVKDNHKGFIGKHLVKIICFLFDRNAHRALWNVIKKHRPLLDSLYWMRLVIVQAHDLSVSGDMDMCDGCPDMTYFQGRLVNSCRLDEFRKYGKLIAGFKQQD